MTLHSIVNTLSLLGRWTRNTTTLRHSVKKERAYMKAISLLCTTKPSALRLQRVVTKVLGLACRLQNLMVATDQSNVRYCGVSHKLKVP